MCVAFFPGSLFPFGGESLGTRLANVVCEGDLVERT